MIKKDFENLVVPNKCRITYRCNWHGSRLKIRDLDYAIKCHDYIADLDNNRYSYRNLVSIEAL